MFFPFCFLFFFVFCFSLSSLSASALAAAATAVLTCSYQRWHRMRWRWIIHTNSSGSHHGFRGSLGQFFLPLMGLLTFINHGKYVEQAADKAERNRNLFVRLVVKASKALLGASHVDAEKAP